jgi:hypothetical protein
VEIHANSFGHPGQESDRDASAVYTGSISGNERFYGLALVAPEDTAETVRRRVGQNQLVGLKPYPDFVTGKPVAEVTVHEMLPAAQMAVADELGLVIMLHIPRPGRLADPVNQVQMVELCKRYPNARIILAHIGRAYFLSNVVGFLDGIAACPNAYIDTAMINHEGVAVFPRSLQPGSTGSRPTASTRSSRCTWPIHLPWRPSMHCATPRCRSSCSTPRWTRRTASMSHPTGSCTTTASTASWTWPACCAGAEDPTRLLLATTVTPPCWQELQIWSVTGMQPTRLLPGVAGTQPTQMRSAPHLQKERCAAIGYCASAMRDTVRAWVRPKCKVTDFLEAYSRAGGTHHSALVLGNHTDAIAAFGRTLGLEVRVIG